jgi:hypothetical protein
MKKTPFKPFNFNVWAKKRFGIVSIKPFDIRPLLARMLFGLKMANAMANAAEGWHPDGMISLWPVDYPYTTRYLMVQYALSTQMPVGGQPPYFSSLPAWSFVQQYQTNRLGIPLGICTDEPDNSTLDTEPFKANIQLLGAGERRTQIGITDSVVTHGTLLVGSSSVAGELTALPSTPGSYWSPGLALSDSEGATGQIEFDPRVQVVNVDVLT